jgi:hypothetical protein
MRYFFLILLLILTGCGYTTGGFTYPEKEIYIRPVINKISITNESRVNATYTSYPIFLEKTLTNNLISKFNAEGYLKVVSTDTSNLILECEITEYRKEALRYTSTEDVEEQRLRLVVHLILRRGADNPIKDTTVIGETSYYLSGSLAKSEEAAQVDLIDDTARRIMEAVIEQW